MLDRFRQFFDLASRSDISSRGSSSSIVPAPRERKKERERVSQQESFAPAAQPPDIPDSKNRRSVRRDVPSDFGLAKCDERLHRQETVALLQQKKLIFARIWKKPLQRFFDPGIFR